MDYVRLGKAGMKVSRICLGMMSYGSQAERAWHLDEAAAEPIVKAAVDGGITFFDTADTYSGGVTEQITGRLLGRLFGRREDYVLATKVYFPMGPGANDRGLSRKHVLAAIDASLRRLGTDYVDLYQIHRWDYDTPIEETMEALHEVVTAGKARYLGASSMFAWQFAKAQHVAERNGWTRFVSMQNHYNLMYREEEREMLRSAPTRASACCRTARSPAACWPATGTARASAGPPGPGTTRCRTSGTTPTPTSTWRTGSRRSRRSTARPRPRSRWPGCSAVPA